MNIPYKIEVTFVGDYADEFTKDEYEEKKDSEHRFALAIDAIINDTGIIPVKGDWIAPLDKPDYGLDIGLIRSRDFSPRDKKIIFEIE